MLFLGEPKVFRIPIIFLTAIVGKKDLGGDSFKEMGGRNFLAKPVQTKDLLEAINKVLENNKT